MLSSVRYLSTNMSLKPTFKAKTKFVLTSRAALTWDKVIRASSKEDPVGSETADTCHPLRLSVDPTCASRKSSSKAVAR